MEEILLVYIRVLQIAKSVKVQPLPPKSHSNTYEYFTKWKKIQLFACLRSGQLDQSFIV